MEAQPLPPPLPVVTLAYAVDRDAGHLRLLAIFHYVQGGLTALFSSIFLFHLAFGIWSLSNPLKPTTGPPPPAEFAWLFIVIGTIVPLFGWTLGGLIVYSGRCIARRRNWTFSLVVAGLMCLTGVLGITLAVFTFIILLRDSVKAEYGIMLLGPARGAGGTV